jgi:hypothetical protein
MFLHSLFQSLKDAVGSGVNRSRRRHGPVRRAQPWTRTVPRLEALEDRMAPAVLTVNTLLDENMQDQFVSLREAINTVNAGTTAGLSAAEKAQITGVLGVNDTIQFGGLTSTIVLNAGQLSIFRSVDIEGPGANLLTIDGNYSSRVFFVANKADLTLDQLTVTHGRATQGAGIDNAGNLVVSNSILTMNYAIGAPGQNGAGGAIFNELNASLVITGSQIVDNSAFGGSATASGAPAGVGGGLVNEGSADVIGSEFTFNQAAGAYGINSGLAGAAYGGAIANCGYDAHLQVEQMSSLYQNKAFGGNAGPGGIGGIAYGGAVANCAVLLEATPTFGFTQVVITDSSVNDNMAHGGGTAIAGFAGGPAQGGAIYNDAELEVFNGDFEANQALGGPAAQGLGGGIYNFGTAHLQGSTLAGNRALGGDLYGQCGPAMGVGGGIANVQAGSFITYLDVVFGSQVLKNVAQGGNGNIMTNGAAGVGGGIANFVGVVNFGGEIVYRNGSITQGPASVLDSNWALGGKGANGGRSLGGGLANLENGTAYVRIGVVTNNVALGGDGIGTNGSIKGALLGIGGDGVGGGIASQAATTMAENSTIQGNHAIGGDGGKGGKGGQGLGGGIGIEMSANLSATNCQVEGNFAKGGDDTAGGNGGDGFGGGIYIGGGTTLSAVSVTVSGNQANGGNGAANGSGVGGGVYDLGLFNPLGNFIFGNVASTSHNDIGP